MNPEPRLLRLAPYAVLLALTASAFLAGVHVPYRVDTDTGFQLRSVQQWVRGESPTPGTLRLPDPRDLSRDGFVWSSFWPPGFPFLYAPLAAAGLSLAAALRATSLLFFLAGALGWLRLARRLDLPPWIGVLYAASLAGYAATLGGAASLRTADILAFTAGPWLIALALKLSEPAVSPARLVLGGVALGASYWLKYSLFLTALALVAWIALGAARNAPGKRDAIMRLTALALGFAMPVAALFALNLAQSASVSESVSGTRAEWEMEDTVSPRPARLAAGLAGAPGLALFQSHLWLTHLTFFSDRTLPLFRGLSDPDRLLAKCLLAIPGTLVLAWGLARAWRQRPCRITALAALLPIGFYLILTVVSALIGYNYLGNEPRLAVGFMPFTQLVALSGWLAGGGEYGRRSWVAVAAFSLFFAAPLVFAVANFARNEVLDRTAIPYAAPPTGLYVPELSPRDVPEVQAAVASALTTPGDVVLLAGPAGWGSSFVMWLDTPGRVLPVSTFFLPLGGLYMDAANLRAARPLRTSRDLRVVLVVAESLTANGWLPQLEARFPQAGAWHRVPEPDHARVAIWWSDLEVP